MGENRVVTLDPDGWKQRAQGWLRVLLTPACWTMNERYSEAWDRELRRLMEKHDFRGGDRYTTRLGPMVIWTANHPYASFCPYPSIGVRARRITVLRAHDKYVEDTIREREGRTHV